MRTSDLIIFTHFVVPVSFNQIIFIFCLELIELLEKCIFVQQLDIYCEICMNTQKGQTSIKKALSIQ